MKFEELVSLSWKRCTGPQRMKIYCTLLQNCLNRVYEQNLNTFDGFDDIESFINSIRRGDRVEAFEIKERLNNHRMPENATYSDMVQDDLITIVVNLYYADNRSCHQIIFNQCAEVINALMDPIVHETLRVDDINYYHVVRQKDEGYNIVCNLTTSMIATLTPSD